MPRAYSMDLRKRVIEACDEGQTIAQVAERFKVSASFVNKLRQRRRQRSTLEPKSHGGGASTLVVPRT
jgi:transposase